MMSVSHNCCRAPCLLRHTAPSATAPWCLQVSGSCDRVHSPKDRHCDYDTKSRKQHGGKFDCLQTHCHMCFNDKSDTLSHCPTKPCCLLNREDAGPFRVSAARRKLHALSRCGWGIKETFVNKFFLFHVFNECAIISFDFSSLYHNRKSMMDSRSRRLPFCLSSSRSSYTSSPTVSSSSSLGSSRLYNRETVLSNDHFPRASSAYKADLDQQVGLPQSFQTYCTEMFKG